MSGLSIAHRFEPERIKADLEMVKACSEDRREEFNEICRRMGYDDEKEWETCSYCCEHLIGSVQWRRKFPDWTPE